MQTEEVTMRNGMAFTTRSFLLRLALTAGLVLFFVVGSRAGGPKCVAGTSYFDATTSGQSLTWPQGVITYYTDQGDLSAVLPNASANSFLAGAFSQWSAVPTAALAITNGGTLAEDVNGTNVMLNSDGSISMPADIQSTATGTPIGIVYDYDGSVTDALLGEGAGGSSECFANAAYGGTDNYGVFATYQHALIVINGQCAQLSSQLTDVQYRLVRVIGSVLGLGWSQVNPNVLTRNPPPTSDDYAGFPVMHPIDPMNCIPITLCYPNPYQLAMDDTAALSRLYPITAQNQSSFPGKQLFSATTARIHGSVWFTDTHGNSTQAMQGVNVVARWIDPKTGLPSRKVVAASVSGFLFTGNGGNPVTGFEDALGDPYSEWGSGSQELEGFFDLAGLQLPNGGSAQYQLTVETLDPKWSAPVGPYSPGPVAPSGLAQPLVVAVSAGVDVQQDILMNGSAQPLPRPASTWTVPAVLPMGGDWEGSLSGYGAVTYFKFPAQANRTLSVAVTALDDLSHASEAKAQPVIGMWAAADPPGTAPPAYTPSPFNQIPYGLTRLDAQLTASASFLIGISDVRGDGRPDYRYHAHLLYADSVSPARVSVSGGAVTVLGTGFAPQLTAAVGSSGATPLAVSAGQMIVALPAHSDGIQNLTVTDPVSGGSSAMTNAVTYGAAPTDTIKLMSGINRSTPVGAQAANPMSVRVLAADGVTPVSGATIGWGASNGMQLSACGGAPSCTTSSDQNGSASTWLTPSATGVANITATLAPGAYSSSPSVSALINATESASDIGLSTLYPWIAQGANVSFPITARVLSNGTPQSNVKVAFTVVAGTGTLSAGSAQTNSSGYATVNLTVKQFAALVQVVACVVPANAPCQALYANPVPLSQQILVPVSGAGQISAGQPFQPVIVRVTDSSSPPNPVLGANVTFLTTVLRSEGVSAMPVILKVSQSSAVTDINGLANIVPSAGGFAAPLEVDLGVTAGANGWIDYPLQVFPAVASGDNDGGTGPPRDGIPVRISRPVEIQN